MTLDLERLKALEANATPGEWKPFFNRIGEEDGERFVNLICATAPRHQVRSNNRGGSMPAADLRFIAEMRNALPDLIDTIERYDAALQFYAGLGTKSGELGEQARAALGDRK